MKIALASDVHLEFGPLEINNDNAADVLILSGDICVARDLTLRDVHNLMGEHTKSHRYHDFFEYCAAQFKHVIYIVGNHEHYNGDYADTVSMIKIKLSYLTNLHVLEKESITLDDVTFVCGTLWTDMNKEDPRTLSSIRGVMNDYKVITNSLRKVSYKTYLPDPDHPYDTDKEIVTFHERDARFSPEDSVEDHKAMLAVIREAVAANPAGKFVVVGHHAPSKLSTKPQYEDEYIMNGAYSSDLSELMLDHPQIKLWTHGHTHHEFDYMIGTCRVVCNPRGYDGYEQQAVDWKLKTFEV
jgi:Icc-related predicted phosphoesterase